MSNKLQPFEKILKKWGIDITLPPAEQWQRMAEFAKSYDFGDPNDHSERSSACIITDTYNSFAAANPEIVINAIIAGDGNAPRIRDFFYGFSRSFPRLMDEVYYKALEKKPITMALRLIEQEAHISKIKKAIISALELGQIELLTPIHVEIAITLLKAGGNGVNMKELKAAYINGLSKDSKNIRDEVVEQLATLKDVLGDAYEDTVLTAVKGKLANTKIADTECVKAFFVVATHLKSHFPNISCEQKIFFGEKRLDSFYILLRPKG